jgi:hypothetical protein
MRSNNMKSGVVRLLAATVLAAGGAASAEWRVLEEAREIIDISAVLTGKPEKPVQTYKSAGENPIPDDDWPDYVA